MNVSSSSSNLFFYFHPPENEFVHSTCQQKAAKKLLPEDLVWQVYLKDNFFFFRSFNPTFKASSNYFDKLSLLI